MTIQVNKIDDMKNSVATAIRNTFHLKQITQRQACITYDINHSELNRILNKRFTGLSLSKLITIAEKLGVSIRLQYVERL